MSIIKKKHDKIVILLAKDKLNHTDFLIFMVLIVSWINHDEFVSLKDNMTL